MTVRLLPLLAAALLLVAAGIVTGMWLSVRLVFDREPRRRGAAVPDGGWRDLERCDSV